MKKNTTLVTAGRPHQRPTHTVNPSVERASTILFATYEDMTASTGKITYGRLGTSTHRALEDAVTALEGGVETRLFGSGLQACALSILAFVKAGDDVLMTDSAYDPTRKFCDRFLTRFGVTTRYYDPSVGASIADLITDKTKVIFAESPGSLTFEVQDLPALASAAKAGGAKLVVDNTWSGGYYLKPLAHGADVSVQAGTKYMSGHSDCLIGSATAADDESARALFHAQLQLGVNVSADDAWLALRGLRSLGARLPLHEANGLKLAKWLVKRPEVARVLHPALKGAPGHALWKRDFTGASSLFGVVLKPVDVAGQRAFFNALSLFGMGYSWGGFESLCIKVEPELNRTATEWRDEGIVLRFHIGLEDVDDLTNDLNGAFEAMAAARG
ncbi:MAG: cystathionine beta-lyase [Pseudomonadota bacterium]